MMCSKVIYAGLIKTEIGNWNSDGYFNRACALLLFVVFSHPIVKITHSVCNMGPYRLTIQMMLLNFHIIFLLSDAQPDFSGTFHQDFSHIAQA